MQHCVLAAATWLEPVHGAAAGEDATAQHSAAATDAAFCAGLLRLRRSSSALQETGSDVYASLQGLASACWIPSRFAADQCLRESRSLCAALSRQERHHLLRYAGHLP